MKKLIGIVIVLVLFLSIFILAQKENEDSGQKTEITVSKVKEKIDKNEDVFVLDVRTEREFNGNLGHIEGATLIPVSELANRLDELKDQKRKEIIVVCRSGNRSGIATNILRENGFNAYNMVGGMIAYRVAEKNK